MRQLKLLFTLSLILLCADLFAQDNSLSKLLNSSAEGNNLAVSNFQTNFLPVEQAYQLNLQVEPDRLHFNWTIHPGYYLYKERFKFKASSSQLNLGAPQFSQALNKWDDVFEKEMAVYYDTASITLPIESASQQISLEIQSQGCADAGLCYPPRTQWLRVDLQAGTAQIDSRPPTKAADAKLPALETQTTLIPVLLAALLGGMILNLMPCVFPVLSIKALSFTRAHHSTASKHLHGLAYSVGVIAAFLAIAALMLSLRSAGEAVGWGFQLQSPLLVSFLIYLFFAMGLAFSGLINLGSNLMSLGQSSTSTNDSLPGSFMTGVLATTVASPCTAPFMGTAIGYTTTQPAGISLLVFGFLGLGMALPFLLLAWIPGLSEKMPKPGPWMETFKQFLAFPLYLAAIWLLWVLGRQTSMDVAAALAVGATLLTLAAWLWSLRGRKTKWLAGIVLVAALALPQTAIRMASEEPAWQPYSPTLLNDLRAEGKPVFVNLTADWCITCLINERNALSSDAFHQALKDLDITYIKGDWTNSDEAITRLLNRYQRNGVPLYLVYPRGSGDAEVLPQLLTESGVLRALQRSAGK